MSDYAVVVFSQDPAKWFDRSRFLSIARPAQQGRFEVRGLPPEEYWAVAVPAAGNDVMDPEVLQRLRPFATSFRVSEGETKTLDLKLKPVPLR